MRFPTTFPTVFASGEPSESLYGRLDWIGESDVDEAQFFNTLQTDQYLFDRGDTSQPLWVDEITILLMPFDNTLDAGNFPTLGNPVLNWRIYRRLSGTSQFTFIEEIPNLSNNTYYDTRTSAGVEYEYGIQSVAQDGTRGGILVSGVIVVSEWGYRLSSIDYNEELATGTSYLFDVEINTDPVSTSSDRTVHETYSTYPKIVRGNRKYEFGGLSLVPKICVDNDAQIAPLSLVEDLYDFLTDGEPKILANGSGETWVVDIDDSNLNRKYFDLLTNTNTGNNNEQPQSFALKWIQIADPQDVL